MAGKYWREAASLIVVGRSVTQKSRHEIPSLYDYQILQMKRSSKSSFMPNAVVFPGGVLDQFDLSPLWLHYYESNGFFKEDWKKLMFKAPRPNFYSNKETSIFPELGFRLCALRETFEETGLILGYDYEKGRSKAFYNRDIANDWMPRVQKNPKEFLSLFNHMAIVPDVWSLSEWCGWLTPTTFQGMKKRFDTAFYIAFIDSTIPEFEHGKHHSEAEQFVSNSPDQTLKLAANEKIWLAPPQVYELGRMCNFKSYDQLKEFSLSRATLGLDSWLPVIIKLKDGDISVLPGDYLYPSSPDYYGDKETQVCKETFEESRTKGLPLNRIELRGKYDFYPVATAVPTCGHVNPVM